MLTREELIVHAVALENSARALRQHIREAAVVLAGKQPTDLSTASLSMGTLSPEELLFFAKSQDLGEYRLDLP